MITNKSRFKVTEMKTASEKSSAYKLTLYPWIKFRTQCQEMRLVWHEQGFKALVKQYGWKFFVIVFCYYLIRDITLYLILPYLVASISTQ